MRESCLAAFQLGANDYTEKMEINMAEDTKDKNRGNQHPPKPPTEKPGGLKKGSVNQVDKPPLTEGKKDSPDK